MPESLEQRLIELKRRLVEINDLKSAGAILSWDQATCMPSGGAVARARQRATLSRLAHQRATDIELGRLLDELQLIQLCSDYNCRDVINSSAALEIPP